VLHGSSSVPGICTDGESVRRQDARCYRYS
jgi:hypothetical protein